MHDVRHGAPRGAKAAGRGAQGRLGPVRARPRRSPRSSSRWTSGAGGRPVPPALRKGIGDPKAEVLIEFKDPPRLPAEFRGYEGLNRLHLGIAPGAGRLLLGSTSTGPATLSSSTARRSKRSSGTAPSTSMARPSNASSPAIRPSQCPATWRLTAGASSIRSLRPGASTGPPHRVRSGRPGARGCG
jgi:hypothetical protein